MAKTKHQEVAEHYEKFPYPDYPLFSLGSWRQLKSVDISNWNLSRPARDLWICGAGTIAPLMFARRNPTLNIVATDLSSAVLRKARSRLWLYGFHNVILKKHDLFASTYRDAFDAIDAYGVIHHTSDPLHALRILSDALRLGGVLRLMIYSKEARQQIEELREEIRKLHIQNIGEIKRYLKKREISLVGDLSNKAGLADAILHPLVHVYDEESVDKLLNSIPALKLESKRSSGNHLLFLKKQEKPL